MAKKEKKLPPAPPSVLVAVPRKVATAELWGPLMWDELHARAVEEGWPILSSAWDPKLAAVEGQPAQEWAIFRLASYREGRAVLCRQTW